MNHWKKFLAGFLIAVAIIPAAYAAVDVRSSAGTSVCTAEHIIFTNGTTPTCSGNTATVVSNGAGTFTAITATSIVNTGVDKALQQYSTQYTRSPVYQASVRPASGAPAGATLYVSNATSGTDCGTAGGGTTFRVCVSDGTNWKTLA